MAKGHDQMRGVGERRAAQEPNHRHRRLLCARRERPSRRAAEQRDELAALHSITSSAREQCRRHGKAERLRTLEAADALELTNTAMSQPISSLPVTSRPIVVI